MAKKAPVIMTPVNFEKATGVHITLEHGGKMSGMQSLSTSASVNPHCVEYAKDPNKVCSKCYASTLMQMRPAMRKCFEKNTEILTSRILKKDELPLLNAALFRFEAFGDLVNETQVINYFNICKANKNTKFALWTKNPFIIQKAIDLGNKKPSNLQIILSSHFLNKVEDASRWSFVDKTFTVYDKDTIQRDGVEINCGARSCLACKKCYLKGKETEIREKLK